MQKKKLIIISALLAFAIGLTGCGTSKKSLDETKGKSSEETSSSVTAGQS